MESVEKVKIDIPTLGEQDIKYRITQLLAELKDAHTYYYDDSENKSLYFPVSFRYFGDELRAKESPKGNPAVLGKRLSAINDIPIEDVKNRLDTLTSFKNNQWSKANRDVKIFRYLIR